MHAVGRAVGQCSGCVMDPSAPLATAEFLVVDTETNGLGGRALRAHRDRRRARRRRRAARPLGDARRRADAAVARHPALHRDHAGDGRRGAAAPRTCCPSSRDADARPRARRALARRSTGACCARRSSARASTWPTPPVLCTVALARRFAPLVRQRKLAALAGSLGIDVEVQHRALPDAETCARVFCALFARLCARGDDDRGRARGCLRPARPRRVRARRAPTAGARCAARASAGPTSAGCPTSRASTSSATPRASRCTSASRSRCARAPARTSRRRRRRRTGRRRPRWSTTARRIRSSARCCSSTG